MDQLLERDAAGAPAEILAEAIEQHMGGHDSTLDDTHHDSAVSSLPQCAFFPASQILREINFIIVVFPDANSRRVSNRSPTNESRRG